MKMKREDFYYGQAGSVNNQRTGGDGNTLFGPCPYRKPHPSLKYLQLERSSTILLDRPAHPYSDRLIHIYGPHLRSLFVHPEPDPAPNSARGRESRSASATGRRGPRLMCVVAEATRRRRELESSIRRGDRRRINVYGEGEGCDPCPSPKCHPIRKCLARVSCNLARGRYIPFPKFLKLMVKEFWRRTGSAHSRDGHASRAEHTTLNYNGTACRLM
jgi:hypothetical protein